MLTDCLPKTLLSFRSPSLRTRRSVGAPAQLTVISLQGPLLAPLRSVGVPVRWGGLTPAIKYQMTLGGPRSLPPHQVIIYSHSPLSLLSSLYTTEWSSLYCTIKLVTVPKSRFPTHRPPRGCDLGFVLRSHLIHSPRVKPNRGGSGFITVPVGVSQRPTHQ